MRRILLAASYPTGAFRGMAVIAAAVFAFAWTAAVAKAAPFAYITGNGVAQFDVGAGGLLTPLTPAVVGSNASRAGIAVSPDGRNAYVANYFSDTVSQFGIGPGGGLSLMSAVSAGKSPDGLTVSPDGKSIYVANQSIAVMPGGGISQGISQYDVGAGGALSPKSPPMVDTQGLGATSVAVSPDGKNTYVTHTRNLISQYDVGEGGTLSPKHPTFLASTGDTPGDIAVTPNNQSVFVTNLLTSNVSQFHVGIGGRLSPKDPATVAAGESPGGIAVSPDGRNAYVTNNLSDSVSQYHIGSAGALIPNRPATVATGPDPGGIAVSPDSHSVYVSGFGAISQYDVGVDGSLSPKTPATVAVGSGGGDVAISPLPGAPSVTGTVPADGASGASRTAPIVASFDRAMDKPSTEAAFSLKRTSNGAPVTGSFSWVGNSLLFTPNTPLTNSRNYAAAVSTGAKDTAGNGLGAAVSWQFTTAPYPLIAAVAPAVDASGVSPSAAVVVAFDKAMDKPSAQSAFSLKRSSDGATVSGTFGWYGETALIFKPDADLATRARYVATVSRAATDLTGHPLPTAKVWGFTTTGP